MYYLKVETTVDNGTFVHDYFEADRDGTLRRQVSRMGEQWWCCDGSDDPESEPPLALDQLPSEHFISAEDFERVWRLAMRADEFGRLSRGAGARGHFAGPAWRCLPDPRV